MRIVLFISLVFAGCISAFAKEDPVHVIVSVKDQNIRVYKGGEIIATSNVSTGKKGYSTPTGIFSILHKRRRHYSNLYGGAPMPFMQRLTWSGIALHASNSVPRYPASHGCIRLPHGFARELFSITDSGAHVVITPDDVAPEKISHETLFQPLPSYNQRGVMDSWLVSHLQENEVYGEVKSRNMPLRIFITRRTQRQEVMDAQRILNSLGYNAGIADGVIGPGTRNAIRAFEEKLFRKPTGEFDTDFLTALYAATGKARPANGHLFVRQNFKPIYDAPVNIRNAREPLGTHLITVMNFDSGDNEANWMSVSLRDRPRVPVYTDEGLLDSEEAEFQPVSNSLSRIEIDPDVRRKVSSMLTPGSSVSISDNGLSLETTPQGSDFIVLTKR